MAGAGLLRAWRFGPSASRKRPLGSEGTLPPPPALNTSWNQPLGPKVWRGFQGEWEDGDSEGGSIRKSHTEGLRYRCHTRVASGFPGHQDQASDPSSCSAVQGPSISSQPCTQSPPWPRGLLHKTHPPCLFLCKAKCFSRTFLTPTEGQTSSSTCPGHVLATALHHHPQEKAAPLSSPCP